MPATDLVLREVTPPKFGGRRGDRPAATDPAQRLTAAAAVAGATGDAARAARQR
jgi:hypothetical protein